jgi:uncharacterized protein
MEREKHYPDDVPLIACVPAREPHAIVIHVPAFSQAKEQAEPILKRLVDAGYIAIGIDAYQHGERGREGRDELTARVFGNFRREMWTILGETIFDIPRVALWARKRFGQLPIHLMGLSMGGDAVVAAAPMVPNTQSVDAVIATPDWKRPGMRDIQTGKVVPSGEPDAKARLFYGALEPLTHLDRYGTVPVHFILGGDDTHVPPDGAHRFRAQLRDLGRGNAITITELAGKRHLDFVTPELWLDDLTVMKHVPI